MPWPCSCYLQAMKILSAEQIRALDKYTIEQQQISSIDLMERAAGKFTEAVLEVISVTDAVYVFCGQGNNGGDGLAVARMLIAEGFNAVKVYVVKHSDKSSADFSVNEERLRPLTAINYISDSAQIPEIDKQAVVIDAIFGSGLSRPAEDFAAAVIHKINDSGCLVYAIDVPSGLYCDKANEDKDAVINATCTYTFHAPKLAFLFANTAKYVSDFKVLDIGLSKDYEKDVEAANEYLDDELIAGMFQKRGKFSHKGTYGHALISAGSYGKMGASVLSVAAALRSGAGLVTAHIPKSGYDIMQTSNPEAMVVVDANDVELTGIAGLEKFTTVGIGPGIGKDDKTADFFEKAMRGFRKPMVIDADGLNIISDFHYLRELIPPGSVLTPHPGEFKRLLGDSADDVVKLQKQINFSKQHNVVIVLKGANTSISTPAGKLYFNSTGNPGMAKGGSGDVLTGVITALMAQGYGAEKAAVIGVFVHGRAGDIAAEVLGQTGMTARDIVQFLPEAFAYFE